jgi:transposase InsO family protein
MVASEKLSPKGGSMTRAGNPYENAMMESFFKTLKYEEVIYVNMRSLRIW